VWCGIVLGTNGRICRSAQRAHAIPIRLDFRVRIGVRVDEIVEIVGQLGGARALARERLRVLRGRAHRVATRPSNGGGGLLAHHGLSAALLLLLLEQRWLGGGRTRHA
jgi:hypothetical protein